AIFAIREGRVGRQAGQFQATWTAIRGSLRSRDLWVVAGFILFWTFSPSIGTPLFFYQTDTLKFSQQFIGTLTSLSSAAAVVDAGGQGSEIVGGWLYDSFGYTWLILISAAFTALCWLLVPLVRVEQIEACAAAPQMAGATPDLTGGLGG